MSIYVILILIIIGLLAGVVLQRRGQRKQLLRMEKMLMDARNGRFQPGSIDENMISGIENSMKLFLQDSLLSEENLQLQKNRIQALISDISHQTITPLSNIMIYSQLLEEELGDGDSGQKAQAIRTQAEKLDFLLKALVKTSRLETGVIKTVPEQCDLIELMRAVISQGAQKAGEKELTLMFEPPKQSVFALCDPKWTREACFNVLDNAIKYTGKGGRIEIVTAGYPMFSRIDILDNGAGMKEEEIPKIFGRFYRGRQAAGEEGVGLGLYLARQIVESEGGYFKVASQERKGSCFSIFLPTAQNMPVDCIK